MPAGRPPWTPVTPTETMSWSVTCPLTCHVRHRLGCSADVDCTAHLQLKDIGSGNFGVAKLMRYKTTGELVAVKFIERGDKVLLCCLLAATMPFVKAFHGSLVHLSAWRSVFAAASHSSLRSNDQHSCTGIAVHAHWSASTAD